jgi:hypothetical protein
MSTAPEDPRAGLPRPDELHGADVHDAAGDRIGTVEDIYVDEEEGYACYVAVSGAAAELYVVPIEVVLVEEGRVALRHPRDAVETGPAISPGTELTREHRERVHGHYGAGYMRPDLMPPEVGGAGYMRPGDMPPETEGAGWMDPEHRRSVRRWRTGV